MLSLEDLLMTIYEFAKLTQEKKATTTWNGTFLAHREQENIKYALYAIEDFFVEVSYETTTENILDFQASKTDRLLKSYIKEIKLAI